jgi:hypothetical protein
MIDPLFGWPALARVGSTIARCLFLYAQCVIYLLTRLSTAEATRGNLAQPAIQRYLPLVSKH